MHKCSVTKFDNEETSHPTMQQLSQHLSCGVFSQYLSRFKTWFQHGWMILVDFETVLFLVFRTLVCPSEMNAENVRLSQKMVSASYIRQGSEARRSHEQLIRRLLEQVGPASACPAVLVWRTG